jgi:hypothetical protein
MRVQERKVQQNGATLLIENHKLDPRSLDENLKPIHLNLRWHLDSIILEGNSIGLDQKISCQESSWFGEPRCKLVSKVISFIVFVVFVEIVQEMKNILCMLGTCLSFDFLAHLVLTQLNLKIHKRLLLEGSHF